MSEKHAKPDELDIEEAAVRAALRRRMAALKETAGKLADPRPWIEERPWTSCGGAAGAGFALGWMLGAPAKGKTAKPREPHEGDHEVRRSMGAMLAASLLPAVQPMIKEIVDNAMGAVGIHHHEPELNQAADVPSPETMSPGMTSDNQVV